MTNDKKFKDYNKYRWFETSSGKLVVGGKSSEQNEELIRHFVENKSQYVVMHTKRPSSPFAVILDDNPTEKDLEECAIFTACFSRGWKECRKKMIIDVFLLEQMIKKTDMKEGTFGVMDTIEHKPVFLKLYLTKQRGKLRAVPFEVKNAISIIPGKIKKEGFAEQLAVKLKVDKQEVIEALPSGSSDLVITVKKAKKKVKKTKKRK